MQTIQLTINYKQMDAVNHALTKCNGSILDKAFNEQVDLQILLPAIEAANFIKRFKPF
jgi:putative IMPACT (imprinted ancient) family translation regulator